MVLTFVLNAINNSYVPWYYGKIKDGKMRDNRAVSLSIAGIMALLLLMIIWFAPEIIRVLAGTKYMEAVYVVPPVAISLLLLFYSQLFINVEFYYEEKKKLIGASIGAAVANLVLNWVFIKLFGFIAAAYTTLASYIIFTCANYIAMKKVLRVRHIEDNAFNYKALIGLFLVFAAVSYIGVALYKYFGPRCAMCILIIIAIIVKRKLFFNFFKKLKNDTESQ